MTGLKRALLAVAPWLPVTLIGGAAAYFEVFRRYAILDDEGFLLASLRFFTDGRALYDEVFSQYGPVYHLVFGAFYKLTGIEIGTQSGRFLVVAIWLISALIVGLAVRRLTGSLLLGVASQAVAFGELALLSGEPMHPVGLICLFLVVLLALVVKFDDFPERTAGALGIVIALLVLTKVNIGLLAGIAIVCAAVLSLSPLRDDRRLRIAALVLLALTPIGLLGADAKQEWVQDLALAVLAALASAVLVLRPQAQAAISRAAIVRFFAGAAGTAVVIVVAILALGTSPGELFHNIVIQPSELRTVFYAPLGAPGATVYLGMASLAAAYVVGRGGLAGQVPKTWWPALARFAAAIVLWTALLSNDPAGFGKSGRIAIPILFAWIALIPPGTGKAGGASFARVAIVLLAVLQTLQVYPVAGTQIEVAALMFVPIGALLLADGVKSLQLAGGWQLGPVRAESVRRYVPAALAVVCAVFAVQAVVRPLITWSDQYRDNVPLALATTGGVRLPEARAREYQAIAKQIEKDCSRLITLPGVLSFNLWTEHPPPDGFNASDWIYLLDEKDQANTVRVLGDDPDVCVLGNYSTLTVWRSTTRKGTIPRHALVRYIEQNAWTERTRGQLMSLVLYRRAHPGDPPSGPLIPAGY